VKPRSNMNLLNIYAVFFVVLLYGPVLLLPMFSFNDSIYIAFPLKAFTFNWYKQMINNTALMEAVWNSVKVGVPVAIISTAFGLLAAMAFTRYRLPGRNIMLGLISVPLVIPYIILGIGNLVVLRRGLDVDLSLWTIAAGHILICTPFSMMVLISRLEGFDKSLVEASSDLGESGWMTFWRVTFPLSLPGVVASLLLAFTTSFDEYVITAFLSGNDATLPLFIYSQLRFPNRLPGVLALGSCILVLSFVVVILAERFRRRGIDSGSHSAI
jgi:spermidine/putrescine transport system permease protein